MNVPLISFKLRRLCVASPSLLQYPVPELREARGQPFSCRVILKHIVLGFGDQVDVSWAIDIGNHTS